MRDFIAGTLGTLLRVVFVLIGIVLIISGLASDKILWAILGVIFLCMAAGIKYALGSIFRIR
jgi:1,4-dihydroxy-2-naphthoate octaprenyltransferase